MTRPTRSPRAQPTTTDATTRSEAGCPDCTDGLGRPAPVPHDGWRHRLRSNPATAQVWRVAVFVVGLLCVVAGIALAVLPGPLTIPPVLLGLWIWSTEFDWARRFFESFARKAREAWAHARLHPVSSVVVTGGGLALAVLAAWSVQHFDLIARGREVVGV